jgi:hypothetical protein
LKQNRFHFYIKCSLENLHLINRPQRSARDIEVKGVGGHEGVLQLSRAGDDNDDDDDGNEAHGWGPFDVVVEESVSPGFGRNASAGTGTGCPEKCLCYESTVRCMMTGRREASLAETVRSTTEVLYVAFPQCH